MEFITAVAGGRIFYVEKQRLRAVLQKPEIQRVPKASNEILGISLWEKKLVVFYNFGVSGPFPGGIVIDIDQGTLGGIGAEAVGVEEAEFDELTALMPGIWEKKCD